MIESVFCNTRNKSISGGEDIKPKMHFFKIRPFRKRLVFYMQHLLFSRQKFSDNIFFKSYFFRKDWAISLLKIKRTNRKPNNYLPFTEVNIFFVRLSIFKNSKEAHLDVIGQVWTSALRCYRFLLYKRAHLEICWTIFNCACCVW